MIITFQFKWGRRAHFPLKLGSCCILEKWRHTFLLHCSHLLAQIKPCKAWKWSLKIKILIFYEWWNYCQFLIKYDFKMCRKYVNGLFCQQGLFFDVCLHFLISRMQTRQHLFLSSLCFFLLPLSPRCLSQAYVIWIWTIRALFSGVANIILMVFTVWYFKKVNLYSCHLNYA